MKKVPPGRRKVQARPGQGKGQTDGMNEDSTGRADLEGGGRVPRCCQGTGSLCFPHSSHWEALGRKQVRWELRAQLGVR